MNNKPFPPRSIFLVLAAVIAVVFLSSCGGGSLATEEPATEAATEAPPDSPTSTQAVPPTSTLEPILIETTPTLLPIFTQSAGNPTPITPLPLTPISPFFTPPAGGESAPALPEFRRLTLEYPSSVKAGAESDVIRLTLEVDSLGNITPTAEIGGNVVEGEVIEIPNLYATHIVTAEAFYEVAGLEVKPSGSTFQPLKQGQPVTFYWSIRAQEVGTYRGTIWLYLNFEDRSSGEKSRGAVSAQIVEIEALDFFGFSTNFVRTSGVVGSVLGSILGFPFFKDIVYFLFRRLRKPAKKRRKSAKKT